MCVKSASLPVGGVVGTAEGFREGLSVGLNVGNCEGRELGFLVGEATCKKLSKQLKLYWPERI